MPWRFPKIKFQNFWNFIFKLSRHLVFWRFPKIKFQNFWNFIFEIVKTPRVLEVPQNKGPKFLELYFLKVSKLKPLCGMELSKIIKFQLQLSFFPYMFNVSKPLMFLRFPKLRWFCVIRKMRFELQSQRHFGFLSQDLRNWTVRRPMLVSANV